MTTEILNVTESSLSSFPFQLVLEWSRPENIQISLVFVKSLEELSRAGYSVLFLRYLTIFSNISRAKSGSEASSERRNVKDMIHFTQAIFIFPYKIIDLRS